MMARIFFTLVAVAAVLALVESGKAGKKGEGKKGGRAEKKCATNIKKFEACLKKGFKAKGNCESGDGELKGKEVRKCKRAEKALKKCDYTCKKPEPTPEPTKKPEPLPYDPSCKRVGFNYVFADIRDFDAASFDDCAKACSKEPGCKSITVRNSDNHCWLKNKNGGETGPEADAKLTSLNMKCDRSNVDYSCKRDSTNFWGADLRSFHTEGFEDCAYHCRDTEDCQSFTLRKSDNFCWLKKKRGGEKGPNPSGGVDSMNIDCTPTPGFDASDRSCALDDFNFWGADLREFKAASYEACSIACDDAADCKSFTLRKSDNNCWLKRMRGGEKGPDPNVGTISRNMECDTSPVDTSCKRELTNFWGADLRDFKVGSFEECANLCRMSENCQSITVRRSDNYCWQKSKRGGQKGPNPSGGNDSMNIMCAKDSAFDASDRKCAQDGFNFWGADLRDFKSSGYEECHRMCFDAADCASFTLRKSDNHCWLKHKAGGANGPSADSNLISANMSC